MFPLSETAIVACLFAVGVAIALVVQYVILRRSWRWAVVLTILVSALIGALVFAEGDIFREISDGYFLMICAVTLTPVFALLWAWGVKRLVPARWVAGALILPPIVLAGYFVERQVVPDARCADLAIEVDVDGHVLTLPLVLGGYVTPEGERDAYRYNADRDAKEGLHHLCGATQGGSRPVEVTRIQVTPSLERYAYGQTCRAEDTGPRCKVLGDVPARRISSIEVMRRDDLTLRYEMSQAQRTPADGIVFRGDEVGGHMCKVVPGTRRAGACRLWREIEPGVVARILSSESRGTEDVDVLVADLDAVLDRFLKVARR